eukprot:11816590-Heterocapsa_arctica.AAC.1
MNNRRKTELDGTYNTNSTQFINHTDLAPLKMNSPKELHPLPNTSGTTWTTGTEASSTPRSTRN